MPIKHVHVLVSHKLVLYQNGCTDFFAYRFSSTHATLCFREIRVSPKVAVPNSELRKLGHSTPTVGVCDINNDSHQLLSVAPGGDKQL